MDLSPRKRSLLHFSRVSLLMGRASGLMIRVRIYSRKNETEKEREIRILKSRHDASVVELQFFAIYTPLKTTFEIVLTFKIPLVTFLFGGPCADRENVSKRKFTDRRLRGATDFLKLEVRRDVRFAASCLYFR